MKSFKGQLPRATTQTGRAVSDQLLRSCVFIVALVLGLALWQSTPWALLPAAFLALAAMFPGPTTTLLMLLLLAISYMVVVPPGSAALFLYVAGLHALFLGMALLSRLPRGTVIPVDVLKLMAVKNLPVQALAQGLAAVALLAGNAPGFLPAVVVSGLSLCILAVWLARAFRRSLGGARHQDMGQ